MSIYSNNNKNANPHAQTLESRVVTHYMPKASIFASEIALNNLRLLFLSLTRFSLHVLVLLD